MIARLTIVALALTAPLTAALAQGPAGPAIPPRTQVLSLNPLGIPFETISVEYEAAVQSAFTVGGNFSYFSPDDWTLATFEVKGRIYPNEDIFRGFAVGLGLGVAHVRESLTTPAGTRERVRKTHPSIGVYVDYSWLLGRSERFYVGTGLGAKRILGDSDEFDDAPFVYGTARFLIGVAF